MMEALENLLEGVSNSRFTYISAFILLKAPGLIFHYLSINKSVISSYACYYLLCSQDLAREHKTAERF